MVLAGLKDRGRGRADVGMPSMGTMLRGTTHVCPPELHVSFFQRIPNSILVSLVQERLNDDDCLRRVRLSSPVRHNAAQLGVVTRIRGKGCVHLQGWLSEATEKVKLGTRSSIMVSLWSWASGELWEFLGLF